MRRRRFGGRLARLRPQRRRRSAVQLRAGDREGHGDVRQGRSRRQATVRGCDRARKIRRSVPRRQDDDEAHSGTCTPAGPYRSRVRRRRPDVRRRRRRYGTGHDRLEPRHVPEPRIGRMHQRSRALRRRGRVSPLRRRNGDRPNRHPRLWRLRRRRVARAGALLSTGARQAVYGLPHEVDADSLPMRG